jgi:uncharacterized protein YneR|tara:strand:+ start:3446 stop:4255 length:810 start_codon:yes stop_codon:yes gene_type:complete
MKADKYLYVNGTSFATGWNKGFEDTYDVAPTFSWVTYLTESIKPKQLYLDAIVGKSIGMTCKDTRLFCEQWIEKHGSLDNLNIMCEFTTPRYRDWDTVKAKNGDDIHPIAHISYEDLNLTEHYFVKREWDNDTMLFTNTRIGQHELEDGVEAEWVKKKDAWYFGGHQIQYFMMYAYEEILALKTFLNEHNASYCMFWCVGRTRLGKVLVDKYMKPLYRDKRLIKTSIFNGHETAATQSIEEFKGHPDEQGHKFMADFIEAYIIKHDLWT